MEDPSRENLEHCEEKQMLNTLIKDNTLENPHRIPKRNIENVLEPSEFGEVENLSLKRAKHSSFETEVLERLSKLEETCAKILSTITNLLNSTVPPLQSQQLTPVPIYRRHEKHKLEDKLNLLKPHSERKSCTVHWKNTAYSAEEITQFVEEDPGVEEYMDKIYSLLNFQIIPQSELPKKLKKSIFTLKSLASETEGFVQEQLMDDWRSVKGMYIIDTHSTQQGLPAYKFPSKEEEGSDRTAKPDFTSAVCPMFLELKVGSMYEVIGQAIERVHVTMAGNEAIHTSLAFAMEKEKAWVFIAKRDFRELISATGGKIQENYYLFPIKIDWLLPLWFEFSHLAVESPATAFVIREAYALASVMRELKYHPGYCAVKILSASPETWIFECTPAINKSNIPPRSEKSSIVIKLTASFKKKSRRLNRAINELAVLGNLRNTRAVDYVIALYDSSHVHRITWFKENVLPQMRWDSDSAVSLRPGLSSVDVQSLEHYWWDYKLPKSNKLRKFLAVIMFPGRERNEQLDYMHAASLLDDLREIHKENVLHCDLRPPNIMWFNINDEIKPFIIDFDLAVMLEEGKSEAVIQLSSSGGQRKAMEEILSKMTRPQMQEITETNQVRWNAKLDEAMLFQTEHMLSNASVVTTPQRSIPRHLIMSRTRSSTH